jgi:Tol biopolymer transport system component
MRKQSLAVCITIMLTLVMAVAAQQRKVIRSEYELAEGQQFDRTGHPFLAVSPDGSRVAFNTSWGLYIRSMDPPTDKLILLPDSDPKQPFFSPDGQWVGYWSQGENQLKKIPINGGTPITLAKTANPSLPSWGVDGTIVYAPRGTGKIMRVPANGGTPVQLCEAPVKQIFAPQILPGGESVLYAQLGGKESQVMVQALKSGQPKALLTMQGTVSRYLPTGHIIYTVERNLFAVPFNLDRLEVTGAPVPMVEGILWMGSTAAPQFAISDSGTLVYAKGLGLSAASGRTLVWVDRKGKEEPLKAPPDSYLYPKISPDGTQVALTIPAGNNTDIWIWNLVRPNMTQFTSDEGADIQSIWTHDSKQLIFFSNPKGKNAAGVYRKAADGTGTADLLGVATDRMLLPWSLSKDGKTLAVTELLGTGNLDIGVVSTEGDRIRKSLLNNKAFAEMQPKISPNGQWMAYASNESGKTEIFVCPFPGIEKGRWQVSPSGGDSPLWSPDGSEIFYRKDDAVMAVSVETEPAFKSGKPKILFRGAYVDLSGNEGHPWDISPDGKRFLMMRDPDRPAALRPKISIAVNWLEELKQRVPVK